MRFGMRESGSRPSPQADAEKLLECLEPADAPANVWQSIEQALNAPQPRDAAHGLKWSWPGYRRLLAASAICASVLVIAFVLAFRKTHPVGKEAGWEVAALTGQVNIGQSKIAATGRLHVGDWLETTANSRAR